MSYFHPQREDLPHQFTPFQTDVIILSTKSKPPTLVYTALLPGITEVYPNLISLFLNHLLNI